MCSDVGNTYVEDSVRDTHIILIFKNKYSPWEAKFLTDNRIKYLAEEQAAASTQKSKTPSTTKEQQVQVSYTAPRPSLAPPPTAPYIC
jgi:hypothetical protein